MTLHPRVAIRAGSDPEAARRLHAKASEVCFIARSVTFPVRPEPATPIAADETHGDAAT
ncbi:hypothetical protein [Arsenicicoccus dermatophilus]|uniref:hypothetical protein n=1 Tax=Arsenicicoccus dermatophilus TaxID=1076331 RepID=UPI001F4D238A|nr:hypothetical protein [Arsenicicoccus dermatophilus]MCH8613201.1 hypothetical protein [Arsenicicoccus dermatophilus]